MPYGFMTKSFLNSTENRQMKQERAKVTAAFEARPRAAVEIPMACPCCVCTPCRFREKPMSETLGWWFPPEKQWWNRGLGTRGKG